MTMDMTSGSLLTLGQQTNPTPLSDASLSTDDWLTTSLGVEVYYGVDVNGSYVEATDFSNPDESGTHAANNPSQLMDMGRFIQHIEIPELLYTGNTDLTWKPWHRIRPTALRLNPSNDLLDIVQWLHINHC